MACRGDVGCSGEWVTGRDGGVFELVSSQSTHVQVVEGGEVFLPCRIAIDAMKWCEIDKGMGLEHVTGSCW